MFIETYYDEKAPVLGRVNESVIPYPELSENELVVWREYLPIRRTAKIFASWFSGEVIPGRVIAEMERAQKGPRPF